jgi:transcriptional regulator with XRE-family HTH domain
MPARIGNPRRRRRHFIKEWREFRQLSQEELGALVGTSKATISRIENMAQGYTQDGIEAIADALGTHVAALLSRLPTEQDVLPGPKTRR